MSENVYGRIVHDDIAIDPREWDNFGHMVCWHNRYRLGDQNNLSRAEFEAYIEEDRNSGNFVDLHLYLLDHSGLSISTRPFNDPWDSGRIGYIYVVKHQIRKEFGIKRIFKKHIDRAIEIMENEVKTYNQWLTGDVWGFEIYKVCSCCGQGEEIIDSCYGFYGRDMKENGMADEIPEEYHYLFEELKEK